MTKWFKGYPKEPGFYWFRTEAGFTEILQLYDAFDSGVMNTRYGTCQADIEDELLDHIVGWLGPIEEPEYPEEEAND